MKKYSPDSVEYYGFDTFEGWNNHQLKRVKSRLSKLGCKFKLIKGNSTKTIPNHINNLPKMDLIFIDGGHSYRVVKCDWRYSKALMKTGTAVFFHNYGSSGVGKVVDDISQDKFSVEILNPSTDYRTALVKSTNAVFDPHSN